MNCEFRQKKVTCKASEAAEYIAQGVCTGFLQLHKSRNGFRVLLPMDRLLLIFSLKQMALIRISLQNCFNNNNCRYHLLLSIIASFTLQTSSDSSQVFLFSSRRLWHYWLVLWWKEMGTLLLWKSMATHFQKFSGFWEIIRESVQEVLVSGFGLMGLVGICTNRSFV